MDDHELQLPYSNEFIIIERHPILGHYIVADPTGVSEESLLSWKQHVEEFPSSMAEEEDPYPGIRELKDD
jgi:hypothetical protein